MKYRKKSILSVFILAFSCLLSSLSAWAQMPTHIPYRKGDLWGYSSADKKIIIAPKYQSASLFDKGIAIVQGEDGKFMLLNTKGDVISKSYDRISRPNDGIFPVVSNGWMGFINNSGKEIVSLQYDDEPESMFKNGLAKVAKTYHDGKKWGFINEQGEEVIPIRYYWIGEFNNGMAVYEDPQKGYGFVDKSGRHIIPADANNQITQVVHFGSSDRTLIKRNGIVVLIDKQGEVIKTYKYDEIGWRYEKVIMVGQHGKWGFIDYNGSIVAPLMYDEDQWGDLPFRKGLGLGVVSVNGQWGVINQQNQPIVPFQYEGLEVFPNNLISVWQSDELGEYQYGVLNKEGEVLPIKYRKVMICNNGYIFAAEAYQWQLFDKDGKLISPKEFYSVDKFSEGLAPATQSLNGKYGYINTEATTVIPSKYDLAQPFKDGIAFVIYRGKEGYIAKDGTQFWE